MNAIDGSGANALVTILLIGAAALGAAGSLGQRPARWHYVVAAVLQVALVAYAALTLVVWGDDGSPARPVVFVLYLVMTLCVIPGTVLWARAEPTRWATVVLAGGALVAAVLVLRLQEVFAGV